MIPVFAELEIANGKACPEQKGHSDTRFSLRWWHLVNQCGALFQRLTVSLTWPFWGFKPLTSDLFGDVTTMVKVYFTARVHSNEVKRIDIKPVIGLEQSASVNLKQNNNIKKTQNKRNIVFCSTVWNPAARFVWFCLPEDCTSKLIMLYMGSGKSINQSSGICRVPQF